MISKENLSYQAQKAYVSTMMQIVGRGLAAISQIDSSVQHELAGLPAGYQISMTVFPDGPAFCIEIGDNGHAKVVDQPHNGKADLTVRFKHIAHAFLVFSFQENTAQAFANDRLIADGNLSHAIRLVRCLSKMESYILPKFIAERAVKRYDDIPLTEKIRTAARIYGLVAKSFVA